jgi:integrase
MALTDAKLRAAKPKAKPYKLTDGRGLYLLVATAGRRYWKFRWVDGAGKEHVLAIGEYPALLLAAAREAADRARIAAKAGGTPTEATIAPPTEGETFEAVARRWHKQNVDRWAPRHGDDVINSLERNLFPSIGAIPIRSVGVPLMRDALRTIEARGAIETGHRIAQRASAVFVFAIAEGIADANPADVMRPALKHVVRGRQPALVDLNALRAMLAKAEAERAHPATKLALRLLAITAVRPGCITGALWTEFEGMNGTEPVWRVPAERMKGRVGNRSEHIVPLPPEAVAVLEAAREECNRAALVFPSVRNVRKPMSANAVGYLLNRSGYHGRHVPHGWRAAFSTIMNERFPADRAVIDLMLAHAPKDQVEAAYNRAEHIKRRRELATEWATLLMNGMRPAADLLTGPRR